MTEQFNILEQLDSVDRIVNAIQQGKKVTLSAYIETNSWNPSTVRPKQDTLVVGTYQGNFFVTWLKDDGTWGNYVGNVDMWMYIPALPTPEGVVTVPVEENPAEKKEVVEEKVEISESEMTEEEASIRQALKECPTRAKAAKKLGISTAKLNSRIKKYNIK